MKYFALLGVLALAAACGSKKEPTYVVPNSGGASGFGATTGHGGSGVHAGSGGSSTLADGGEAGAVNDDPLAPTVEITSPLPASDPATDKLLTAPEVKVTCTVAQSTAPGATPVLGSSIKIRMLGADGKQVGADGSVLSTPNANEYYASFVLTSVPSGPVSFTCSASDSATIAHASTTTVTTFYDAGPTIILSNPPEGSAHSLSAILFEFSAQPAPLSAADSGADVDSVTLKVDDVDIKPATVKGMPGSYQVSVDLNDSKVFTRTPAGLVPVTITATNKRGTIATAKHSFIVDSTGPVITIVSPPTTDVQFIGGQVTIEFTAVDEAKGSGVNPDTLSVTVNTGNPVLYHEGDHWHALPDGKTFDYSFNTIEYSSQYQISVTIAGADRAGNVSPGASAQYYVDNVPPIVDLQPPDLQEEDNGPSYICSAPFDPLGVSPNDLDVVPSVNTFRALVWDQGNVPDGNGISFFSGVNDNAGVHLYFQADPSAPLLKNKSNTPGGICDDIADTSLPFASLTPATPAGAPFFPKDAPLVSDCTAGNQTVRPPDTVCGNVSDLARVIAHDNAKGGSAIPVIYGVQVDAAQFCSGSTLALTTKVAQDGWVCAAVVAQDKIGNRSVSAPIRLCLDAADSEGLPYKDHPACATQSIAPPSCVGTGINACTPPSHFPYKVIKRPQGT